MLHYLYFDILERVHDFDLDILEVLYNLHFSVEFVSLAVFGNRAILLVNHYIRRRRADGEFVDSSAGHPVLIPYPTHTYIYI